MLDMVAIGLLACVEQGVEGLGRGVGDDKERVKWQLLTAKGECTLFRLCMRSFTD